jgi:hypothetical protein
VALWRADNPGPKPVQAIVGAARRVHLDRRAEVERIRLQQTSPEQRIAWRHYNTIGEVNYAYNYIASMMSRVRLFAAYHPDGRDGPPVPIGVPGDVDRSLVTAARDEMAKINNAYGGQPGFMRSASLNWSVAGEFHLAEIGDRLGVYSTSELRVEANGRVTLRSRRIESELNPVPLDKETFVARFWRPHPEFSDDADSALMAVREVCNELLLLSRMIQSSARSQINAGILLVAKELEFERADAPPDVDVEEDVGDPFEEELIAALTESVEDSDALMSVTPILARVPSAMLKDAILRVGLERAFDETAVQLRETALERVLNGIDIPKDLVTGLANDDQREPQQGAHRADGRRVL